LQMAMVLSAPLAGSLTHAQDARLQFKSGMIAQAVFVAPAIGPAQQAEFQINSTNEHGLRGYLIGSEGLCHGRFQVEGRWAANELLIKSPSRFGTINARLRSAGERILKGPFTVSGKQGELTLTLRD